MLSKFPYLFFKTENSADVENFWNYSYIIINDGILQIDSAMNTGEMKAVTANPKAVFRVIWLKH